MAPAGRRGTRTSSSAPSSSRRRSTTIPISRAHSRKTASASWFYRVLAKLRDVDPPGTAVDFRLVDRKALDAFRQMRETNRYVRGMFGWVGFRQCTVEYSRPARFAGTTKYPLRKMMKFAFDGIISFSNAPLRIALRIGFILSFLSITAAIVTLFLSSPAPRGAGMDLHDLRDHVPSAAFSC
jgi:hypothetical protein